MGYFLFCDKKAQKRWTNIQVFRVLMQNLLEIDVKIAYYYYMADAAVCALHQIERE